MAALAKTHKTGREIGNALRAYLLRGHGSRPLSRTTQNNGATPAHLIGCSIESSHPVECELAAEEEEVRVRTQVPNCSSVT